MIFKHYFERQFQRFDRFFVNQKKRAPDLDNRHFFCPVWHSLRRPKKHALIVRQILAHYAACPATHRVAFRSDALNSYNCRPKTRLTDGWLGRWVEGGTRYFLFGWLDGHGHRWRDGGMRGRRRGSHQPPLIDTLLYKTFSVSRQSPLLDNLNY